MIITTRHEIKEVRVTNSWSGASNLDEGRAYLIIHVSINGADKYNFVAMSGAKEDIEAFVRDEIDADEIARRGMGKVA